MGALGKEKTEKPTGAPPSRMPADAPTASPSPAPTANPYEQLTQPPPKAASTGGTGSTTASAPPAPQVTGAAAPAPGPSGPQQPPGPTGSNTQAVGATQNAQANPYAGLAGGNTNMSQNTPRPPDTSEKPVQDPNKSAKGPYQLVEGNPFAMDPNAGKQSGQNPGSVPKLAGDAAAAMGYGSPPEQTASTTGHINFDQLYGANAGVAKRESDKRVAAAMAQAKKAQAELAALQQQFTQATQVGAGPSAADNAWGSFQESPTDIWSDDLSNTANDAATEAEVLAGAQKGYGGPGALSELDAYQKLLQDTGSAAEGVNALQSQEGLQAMGMNATDAALLQGAGRPRFAHLGDMYGGLGSDVENANLASIGQADDARSAADKNRAAYQALLDQRGASDAEAKSRIDAAQNEFNQKQQKDQAAAKAAKELEGVIKNGTWQHTKQNENGEYVWDDEASQWDDATIFRETGADRTFEQAKNPAYAPSLVKYLGVSQKDADFLIGAMTSADWAAFKVAARQGPSAMRKWADDIIARRAR